MSEFPNSLNDEEQAAVEDFLDNGTFGFVKSPSVKPALEIPSFFLPLVPKFGNKLAKLMFELGTLSLSASHVQWNMRLFVMRTHPDITICVDPRVVDYSAETVRMEESDPSRPGLHLKIERPAHIRVRYKDHTGQVVTEKLTGLTARQFLHELDRLDGIDFINRAGPVARDLALRKAKKFKKPKVR